MQPLRRYHIGLVIILFFGAILTGKAQSFGLGLTSSPSVGMLNSNILFTLRVTNLSQTTLNSLTISNTFPSSFQLVTGAGSGGFTNAGSGRSVLVTNNLNFGFGDVLVVNFRMNPTASGIFTNTTVVSSFSNLAVPATSLNNIVQVASGNTDLGVSINIPSTNAFPGDVAQYSVVVTNAGPGAASGFFVTNTFPAGVGLVQVTPGTGATTNTPGRVVFSVSSLAVGSSLTNTISIIPTNSGALTLTASIGTIGLTDTNASNNSATATLTVTAPDTNQLTATFSNQVLDRQTGLFVQTVTLVNTSATTVASARLIVVGLASSNKLYNAVGTNLGNPFVVYPNAITNGQSVDFLLEFYYPSRIPQTNLTYIAYGVPMPNLITTTNGTALSLEVLDVSANRVLLEFPSTPGKTYRIVYSSAPDFSNPLMAEPPVKANADKTQWIDEGPPKTISLPGNSGSRFYKVFQQ